MLKLLDIPEEIYHGDEYSDYINGSSIWEVYSTCPAQYKYSVSTTSKALEFGTQVHCAVLENELFKTKYVVEPDWSDCLSSDAAMKAWLKDSGQTGYSTKKTHQLIDMIHAVDPTVKVKLIEQANWSESIGDVEIIKQQDMDQLTLMHRTIHQFSAYSDLINNGHNEKSIVGEMDFEGIGKIKVKTRPDIISNDYLSITNYKTAASAKPADVVKACLNHGYFAKEMFNYDVYIQWMKESGANEETIAQVKVQILAQQKTAPFLPCGITLSPDQMALGREQYQKGLRALVGAINTDSWSCYTDGFITTETPSWAFYE